MQEYSSSQDASPQILLKWFLDDDVSMSEEDMTQSLSSLLGATVNVAAIIDKCHDVPVPFLRLDLRRQFSPDIYNADL